MWYLSILYFKGSIEGMYCILNQRLFKANVVYFLYAFFNTGPWKPQLAYKIKAIKPHTSTKSITNTPTPPHSKVQQVQEETAQLIVAYSGEKAREIQQHEMDVVDAWRKLQLKADHRKITLSDSNDLYRWPGIYFGGVLQVEKALVWSHLISHS